MTSSAASSTPPRQSAWGIAPEDQALRGESFSREHLQEHARHLAAELEVAPQLAGDDRFAARFEENAALLRRAYEHISASVREGDVVTTDAEWLLDNFYVVEEQLREIREDLPRRYYLELPKLASGEPRIFVLSLELIAHTDSALDEETIVGFVHAFQEVAPLSIGEVWAFPIMLRLGLVENLRRLASQMLATRQCRSRAQQILTHWRTHEDFEIDLSSLDRCAPLVLQLLEQAPAHSSQAAAALKTLERQLAERRLDPHDVVRSEHQRQAANQVSIGNVVTSMRLISALNWVVFFERTNLAEQVLREDPAEVYPRMDFETRDSYRHVVERLAKRTHHTDLEVAQQAVAMARQAQPRKPAHWQEHVGYFLVDRGRAQLEAALAYRPTLAERVRRWVLGHPAFAYLGLVALITAGATALAAWLALAAGASSTVAAGMAFLALVPATELAVSLTNLLVTSWLPCRLLPKLDFKDGIPPHCSTIVVVPSLLSSPREVDSLVQRLELHYLANPDPALRFALLTDFADAPQARMPGDEALLAQAARGIAELNAHYAPGDRGAFFLFHRHRQWNAQERVWMGWERKRGKLMEFNRLLRGAGNTSFDVDQLDLAALRSGPRIQFVITLDADTQLPHGTAARLIGALAHPLNRPRFVGSRIVEGYAVLQPRVSVDLGSANRSWFARIVANSPGIDPYATCASDVYQDLFGEGNFTGKGIYDLDAFEKVLDGAFPDNHILSHDLIEGCHLRVALVSDIELIDGFPHRYDAESRRQHRWVRGDWQLLPWLLPWVPSATGWRRNPLSLLCRWKIVDNLRRSLAPPLVMLWLLVTWLFFPIQAWLATCGSLLVLAFPLLAQLFTTVRGWPQNVAWLDHARSIGRDWWRTFLQFVLSIAFLPHKAYVMLDAIGRTLARLLVTRRKMLEWETASATERRLRASRWSPGLVMWFSPVLAIVLALVLSGPALVAAAPFLAAWTVAPVVAWWISLPRVRRQIPVTQADRRWLRLLSRQTWSFFEAFVGQEDHWLPPDNFQEYPAEKVAHRISPTNEGLFLASALAARDLGYVPLHALAEMWTRNLESWLKLDRLHGHFYNWYDTTTLQPLYPRYVSTVDSGNLAACFLVLCRGIEDLRTAPVMSPALWAGLLDTVELVTEACQRLHPRGARFVSAPLDDLTAAAAAMGQPGSEPADLRKWHDRLSDLTQGAEAVRNKLAVFDSSSGLPGADVAAKAQCLLRFVEGLATDFDSLFPWVAILSENGFGFRASGPELNREPETQNPQLVSAWEQLQQLLLASQSLGQLEQLDELSAPHLAVLHDAWTSSGAPNESGLEWLTRLRRALTASTQAAAALSRQFQRLAQQMETLALEMDFRFLFNHQRRLFAIGYNLEDGRLDRSHYDMLASEARLASYFAIAKGDVEHQHWFLLTRPMTQTAGYFALLSWGGTMFEYLMPQLFQRAYEGSLLAQSCRAAVARQIEYGKQHRIPWGISESAFGALAVNLDYHYRSFGVPGLGLKRGLAKDLVVSPYSSMLALEVDAHAAVANLHALAGEGGLGSWGFYDAIDFSPDRVPAGKRSIVARCYMSHHQGMSLLALANLLAGETARRRFHAHPLAQAAELLLQERVPAIVHRVQPHYDEVATEPLVLPEDELVSRRLTGLDTPAPRTHLLSNGQYAVMVTSTGGGFSRWRDVAVTRWRADVTRDHWGQFIYLRDLTTGRVWSAGYQPTRSEPDAYEVVFSIDKAEYHRRDGTLETHLEVAVSPENNAEIRQVKVTNHGSRPTEIEITSYAEIVLADLGADLAHPAFHKLFMETEYIPEETALLAKRRPRDASQEPRFGVHVLAGDGDVVATAKWETSRQAFLGRCRTLAEPAAMLPSARLTGTTGAVLDPIFSLRCRVSILPNESATVAFATALAASRKEALILADQYHDPRGVQRAFELAWAYSQVELRHLHLSPAKAHLYQRLASAVLYPDPALRGSPELLRANRQSQGGLWRWGISGDLPIILVRVTRPDQLAFVREVLAAHEYWRSHGLKVDLVILNDHPGSYLDALHEQLIALLAETQHKPDEKPAGIVLLRGAQIPREDQALLESSASVVLHGERGALMRQLEAASGSAGSRQAARKLLAAAQEGNGRKGGRPAAAPLGTAKASGITPGLPRDSVREISQALEFWNGSGGFAEQGREYRIHLAGGKTTPMPWTNVVANPDFGFLVTESGGGYTWAGNSRQFKLTAWANDPIADPPSELLYVRDERTGAFWRPLPQPGCDQGEYWIHHGQGYSRFLHTAAEIEHDTLLSIAAGDPVKFICVTLRNRSRTRRHLSLTYYAEWVLGVHRQETQLHVATGLDESTGALTARNAYAAEGGERIVFLYASGTDRSVTGNRTEFVGRNRDFLFPDAMRLSRLSGFTGAGVDPCGAVQTRIALERGQSVEVIFLLGAASDERHLRALVARYGSPGPVRQAIDETIEQWDDTLGALQVATPNRAFDLLVNRWLLYQTLCCRVWARSAYYQSGGAYGFRDQLQDVMALVYSRPDLAREHLLHAASRQYEEGDVQHWWHPTTGHGTRTRFSDDYLWLPFAACHYARTTGDESLWNENVPFLHSLPLDPGEQERYELPAVSPQSASFYEHCRRAVRRGFRLGPHGLPLMGCGDWNDGMNKVGALGEGESVWVGWFLLAVVPQFLAVMRAQAQEKEAHDLQLLSERLRQSQEERAWDGQWYLRALFDDGSPLGSHRNEECQIDSIAQSWAVMADADPVRRQQAMESVWQRLVRLEDKLVLLCTPPFDASPIDPGYIKGYLPGIRENGGQYTHAALWVIQAFALLGDAQRAMQLFDLANPIRHALTPADVRTYRVEPYVVAADVYSVPPHTSRGGWTWYTGSAAWMYRVAIEQILGLHIEYQRLRLRPCIPADWPKLEIVYRYRRTTYRILVLHEPGKHERSRLFIDGRVQKTLDCPLEDDGGTHEIVLHWTGNALAELDKGHERRPAGMGLTPLEFPPPESWVDGGGPPRAR